MKRLLAATAIALLPFAAQAQDPCCATGDLGLVIERATGSLCFLIVQSMPPWHRFPALGICPTRQ